MGIFEVFRNRDKHTLARVVRLCTESDGSRGIWKRIDENRELLECLQEHAPEFLERCRWVDGWIAGTDIFLNNLASALELSTPEWLVLLHSPRPWPGRFDVEKFYECSAPAKCLSSSAWQGEQAPGKD